MKWPRLGKRPPPWLIVGLGNPGPRYAESRHNVGFLVVDLLAERYNVAMGHTQPHAFFGKGIILDPSSNGPVRVVIAKPRTYMNASGDAVTRLAQSNRIPKGQVVLIYDELDLPLGKLRIRARGSAGGHNGMKSIITNMGTDHLARVRVGIGRPSGLGAARGHVLGDFSAAEQTLIRPALLNAADAVDWIVKTGLESAMNKFNQGAGSETAGNTCP